MKRSIIFISALFFLISCKSDKSESKAELNQTNPETAEVKVKENPLKDAYFGEEHLHTGVSMDAYIAGTRIGPDDAYKFAKGEQVKVNGQMHQIKRPLDWCAVTDHSEFMGEAYTLMNPESENYDSEVPTKFRNATDYQEALGLYKTYVLDVLAGGDNPHAEFWEGWEAVKSTWKANFEATEKHYEPGKFTTIHAYEWSSAPNEGNSHRNVFFRDTNVPDIPFSSNESKDPEDLWAWMQDQRDKGMRVFAVPHNSNESKGLDFPEQTLSGGPITKEYVETRNSMEPLIEMMQIKGNSEVVSQFWQKDEFADFENAPSIAKFNDRKFEKRNFVRYGLTRGLKYEQDLGTNPFKYGFAGGTDSHNGSPSNVEEDNWKVGGHGLADRTPEDRANNDMDGEMTVADMNPGAITGVWATSNTREAIWDGMYNKETFATSGPRIKVRAFAGQGFDTSKTSYEDIITDAYDKGVPMGQDYKGDTAPQILVWAIKDPIGPNLDRIQIIKGWVENGELKDKIFNVVASGDRLKSDGSVEPIDAPVNLETGEFNTEKGAPELSGVWTDPEFNPDQYAYYYVRVLQLPTARWNLFDEIRAGVDFPDRIPKQIVERAWASPFWYSPE
ncbi:DUF3604 domain-containing protein [Gramella sp. GC03-9]|uniref:DUF3604 domain-containing protein n=1 Tax=Christiangramia oceanisediminis TaxID=2920386 RepID=A0A9X2KY77_9FLAO|nr:DUF3604 domain-containing protein [Gramella oceanisediminis]MCP9200493.1 DUF3604 domain-containing protein [Gramella oceanisediminis]